ncbi:hypothetical protein [Rhodococcus kronopolitis]|uniref:Transmembrane protein n=1 Tax=Rhodococcus kronopolitis TaxID=1460226 RepID=A0ABV9FTQ9_9NOCA
MSEGGANTGQVSVAELLARNGQQVESRGGRRRRGVPGGISVAELTGEIPVVRDRAPEPEPAPKVEAPDPSPELPAFMTIPEVPSSVTPSVAPSLTIPEVTPSVAPSVTIPEVPSSLTIPEVPSVTPATPVLAPSVTIPEVPSSVTPSVAVSVTTAKAEADPASAPQMRTVSAPAAAEPAAAAAPAGEEHTQMIPAIDKAILAQADARKSSIGKPRSTKARASAAAGKSDPDTARSAGAFRPYSGSEPALLSGAAPQDDSTGQTQVVRSVREESLDEARAQVHTTGEVPRVTDTPPRSRRRRSDADSDAADSSAAEDATTDDGAAGSPARQWAVLIGQAVVAIVAGGLLFKGFETLWEMLPWVALVLAVLVIAGLVAVVRILRQTDDMVSLLIAIVVGVFVTIGPLAFVLSTS